MAKRGRPPGSKSVPQGRDASVVIAVALAIYQTVHADKRIALRDRSAVAGRLSRKPSASAYKLAQAALAKEGLHLGVDLVESIYKTNKSAFFGGGDLVKSSLAMKRMMILMQGLPTTPEPPFVPEGDRPEDDASVCRPKIARQVVKRTT